MDNSPPPRPEMESTAFQFFNEDDNPSSSTLLWDWSDLLDFDDLTTNTTTTFHPVSDPPTTAPPIPPIIQRDSNEIPSVIQPEINNTSSDKIRKRDPRLTCSNFLAGRVPCACPELDAKLAEEEEEEIGPGKKRSRIVRTGSGATRCQVPGCGADISELKGYHRRHRICLGCANASTVVFDGETKRYCQQCGKFHVLSDFDEGKRSCRRKLERHNNRRRRKSTESKGLTENEPQHVLLAEDTVCLNNQAAEGDTLLDSDGHAPILCSAPGSQNIRSDSGASLAGSGETQCDEEKEKCTQSQSYYDNKTAISSVCPTGRISFKLYDWNPAEFPRRLRHQIFQWLASMPVELEGYIRPGCTILTVFIAMPNYMWVKLFENPLVYIRDLVAPGNMLSGRGTFYVYLNNMIFRVMKDGTSVVKIHTGKQSPKLHYVHPTCFEAGKPMEFVVCGSNLLQTKFRFLVSFSGEYLRCNCVSPLFNKSVEDTARSLDHQLFRICVPQTESNLFGPAFVEVENEFGLSNFIPILIGDKEICLEMNIIQQRLDMSLCSNGSQFAATTSSLCEVSRSRQKYFSGYILDVAWLLKDPVLENKQQTLISSSQIQRLNCLFRFLIENESSTILERVVDYVKVVMNNSLTDGVADADLKLYQRNIDHVSGLLFQKFQNKVVNPVLGVRNLVSKGDHFDQSSKIDVLPVVPVTNEDKPNATTPLLNAEVVMNVNIRKESLRKSPSLLFTNKVLTSRPLIFVVSAAAVCFGICAVALHPRKVGEIAITIRRCLFENHS